MKELAAISGTALPFLLVVATSFIKFAVVLAILRRAIGASAIPPATVTLILAALFSLFITAPVGEQIFKAKDLAGGLEPVRAFFVKHAPERERQSFFELQKQLRPAEERAQVSEHDLMVLAPAFATAELKAAFQIGFLLFLPFLIIELVVAMVLQSVGMYSLQPETVSLPFKLLLFVLADGWHLLLRGVVLSYI